MWSWRWVAASVGGVVAVLAISLAGATSLGTRCYDPSLMASWVQAVGTIGAILGAILAGDRQAAHARSHAADQDKKLIDNKWQGALAIVGAMEEAANRVAVDLNFNEPLTYNPAWFFNEKYRESDFLDLDRALEIIPLHELPYAIAASRFISLRRNFKLLIEYLKRVLADHGSIQGSDFRASYFADVYAEVQEVVSDIREDAAGVKQRYEEMKAK